LTAHTENWVVQVDERPGSDRHMKLLVLAPEAVDAAAVRRALPGEDLSDTEVLVVSPAINPSGLRFWMSDADDAIDRAGEASQATANAVRAEGGHARAATGESEPLLALQDALATFPADRVVVFGDGVDAAEAQERFGVPVTAV
jgi:hypothetical protein